MNEFFQKLITQIKTLWGKLSLIQKIILFAVIAVSILGIVLLVNYSASPSMVPLITSSVTDQDQLSRISRRLDEEGVPHTITEDGQVFVKDKQTAQRMVVVLMREDLIPKEANPWDVFKMDRWSVTDFERNVNLRQAITTSIEQHIESLDEVDSAQVTLVIPEQALFQEDQNPVTASVIITLSPGSDFSENRKKIEGVEKLVLFGVEGLKKENLVISDHNGIVLNDFVGMAEFDRLELSKRQLDQKALLENKYKSQIFQELSQIFGARRVSVLKVDIDLDFRKETVETEEHFPVTTVPDNPNTPYSEREFVLSIPRSKELVNEEFKGTGFNPEGPPGQEGQTPPAYKDLDNLVGEYKNNSQIINEEVNTRNVYEEKSPWEINRITIGVALDGVWEKKYNKNGTVRIDEEGHIVRDYVAVSDDSLAKAKDLVQHAIGFNKERGDSVTVQHIQFDRSNEFQQEDEKYRSRKRVQQIVLYSVLGICVIMIAFIVFRLISRELERRRRLREEELARQHQMAREAVLRSAEEEEEGMEVGMSVEERARMEMHENAINMAREHPEDVAQLIRTWLAEE